MDSGASGRGKSVDRIALLRFKTSELLCCNSPSLQFHSFSVESSSHHQKYGGEHLIFVSCSSCDGTESVLTQNVLALALAKVSFRESGVEENPVRLTRDIDLWTGLSYHSDSRN